MRAIVLHSIWCHYEMLGSVLQQFGDNYAIDIYFPQMTHEILSWINIYRKRFDFAVVSTVTGKYDLSILHTDDDLEMCKLYTAQLYPCPIYVINHCKVGCRSTIPKDTLINIDIHGIQQYGNRFHFCGYDYVTINEKIRALSPKTSICVIGAISKEEVNFLDEMQARIINFGDIEIYIINRTLPPWYNPDTTPPNVKLYISVSAEEMFKLLVRSHYVYFFAYKRGISTCSASFGLSYTTLCRMVCGDRSRVQYELTSPIFKAMDDKFSLNPLTSDEIREIYAERTTLIQKTSATLRLEHI